MHLEEIVRNAKTGGGRILSMSAALFPLLLLAFVLAFVSCDKDDPACRPEVPAGRIYGQIRSGGIPMQGVVQAKRLPEGNHLESSFEVEADDSGFYSVDLPAGRYILTLRVGGSYQAAYDYAAAGLNYGQSTPDTLVIGDEMAARKIDFLFGGLSLNLNMGLQLDGERGEVHLHARTLPPSQEWRTHVHMGGAEIENGHLNVLIPGILPDDYRVELLLGIRHYLCDCAYDGEHVWYPGVQDSTDSPWIEIGPDSSTALAMELSAQPARIEGIVSGAWLDFPDAGEPEVSVYTVDAKTIIGPRIVDTNGRFGLDVHLPCPVKLRVTQDGMAQWIGGPAFDDATVYDLEMGETISGIELRQCGIRFVGEIPNSDFAFLRIEFHDPVDHRLLSACHSNIAPSTPRFVSNLWPGRFLMYVGYDPPGRTRWAPQWYDQAFSPADAEVILISSPGDVVDLPLVLKPGGVLRGMAQAGDDCYVIVTPADDQKPWGYDYAWSPEFNFEVLGLPDGEYKIGAYLMQAADDWDWPDVPSASMRWYPGESTWEEAETVTILDAGTVEGITLTAE